MNRIFLVSTLFFSSLAWSGPAVLFEEVEVPGIQKESASPRSSKRSIETEIKPLSQRSTLKSVYEGQEFGSTDELRSRRRVGFGAVTAGATGLLGALIELNLTPGSSVITAFGGGPGFSAFNFQWKHVFGGESFSPYAGFGYARWYNASGGSGKLDQTTPSILGNRFLTEDQKRSGQFAVDLLNPSIGIQYNQLHGEYTGMGLFAEVDFLTKIPDFSPVPTGALGILYYF